jgi:hypothetical protein
VLDAPHDPAIVLIAPSLVLIVELTVGVKAGVASKI